MVPIAAKMAFMKRAKPNTMPFQLRRDSVCNEDTASSYCRISCSALNWRNTVVRRAAKPGLATIAEALAFALDS